MKHDFFDKKVILLFPLHYALCYYSPMPKTNPKIQIKNPSLQKLTKGINKKQILGVALDLSKEFHRVVLCDFNGKILVKHFSINSLKSGYEKLKNKIVIIYRKINAKQIIIAMEPLGTFSQNIAYHLRKDFKNIFFINPFATASNRNQKMLVGQKTDDIDASCIADLLIRGECYSYALESNNYFELKEKIYWREHKLKVLIILKHQIIRRMNMIYPGCSAHFDGNKPLFVRMFDSDMGVALMDLALPIDEIAKLTPESLSRLFNSKGHKIGRFKSKSIINYFNKMLIPNNSFSQIHIELLKRDAHLLKTLENEIKEIEERVIELAKQTPAKILFNQIEGISDIMIASYIGCIGNISHYQNAGKIYSKSGLAPKIMQSGLSTGPKLGIKRAGNRILRSTLFRMAKMASWHEQFFKDYYSRIRPGKTGKETLIATANKINRIMFAMMKKQEKFKPADH